MRKWALFLVLLIAAAIFTACGSEQENESGGNETDNTDNQAEEMTITHEYGKATVKKNPKNVVVFDFGVLDTLDELDIKVTGVPQATVPAYLEKYTGNEFTNVGSLKEPVR